MLLKNPRALARTFFTLFLLSIPLAAQTNTSTIAGVVTDESGAPVPDAKVVATLPATGQQREVSTNSSGEFVVSQIGPGLYRISVTKNGFQTAVVDNLTLNIA